jgi:hypothetical protein
MAEMVPLFPPNEEATFSMQLALPGFCMTRQPAPAHSSLLNLRGPAAFRCQESTVRSVELSLAVTGWRLPRYQQVTALDRGQRIQMPATLSFSQLSTLMPA